MYLDIDQWKRKSHFHFFRKYEEPFFGICVDVDCTDAQKFAKAQGVSFFLYYLYQSLRAANEIEPFRYRIVDQERVWVCESIGAAPTINRPDGTFGFASLPYRESFEAFLEDALPIVERVQRETGLEDGSGQGDVIHYSSLPWLTFTSLSHARRFSARDSIPKISFGQARLESGRLQMPLSIHVHHALVDGRDVGLYVERFQELMDSSK